METLVKERISENFVKSLCVNEFVTIAKPQPDVGCDYCIAFGDYSMVGEHKEFQETGEKLDIQLKSTTEHRITTIKNHISYPAEAKTIRKLVRRRDKKNLTPYILILFILPDNKDDWVTVHKDHLKICKAAYWYYPPENVKMPINNNNKTIYIPLSNKLDTDCLRSIYEQLTEG